MERKDDGSGREDGMDDGMDEGMDDGKDEGMDDGSVMEFSRESTRVVAGRAHPPRHPALAGCRYRFGSQIENCNIKFL